MLSFSKGLAVARIEGGKDHGKIIYIDDDTDQNNKQSDIKLTDQDIFDILSVDYFRNKKKKLTPEELDALIDSIYNDIEPLANEMNKIYHDAKKDLNNNLMNEFNINDDGKFVQLPRKVKGEKQRDNLFIAGASGSGKSYYTANYAEEYTKMYPDNKIYLFSRVLDDERLDNIEKLQRIVINDELIDDPIMTEELANSLVIFDDIDTIKNEELKNEIMHMRQDILEIGRHPNIYCISTAHMLTNYKETRSLLNESNEVIFFPKSSGTKQIKYFLQSHAGMGSKDIKKVFNLKSRWVMLSKNYPQFILSEKSIYLVSNDT